MCPEGGKTMSEYYGDVIVTVKMRYRVAMEFEGEGKPTPEQMLDALEHCTYDDITDEERLTVLSVDDVRKNCHREE
jgi:hypothetical protein